MIIANRTLKLRTAADIVDIPIRFYAAEQSDNGAWSCRYEIEWPDGKRTMDSWGIDSTQAILLAFQMVGSELYTTNYHKAGALFFEAPGRGYGFPIASSLRDLLIGDDRKFY